MPSSPQDDAQILAEHLREIFNSGASREDLGRAALEHGAFDRLLWKSVRTAVRSAKPPGSEEEEWDVFLETWEKFLNRWRTFLRTFDPLHEEASHYLSSTVSRAVKKAAKRVLDNRNATPTDPTGWVKDQPDDKVKDPRREAEDHEEREILGDLIKSLEGDEKKYWQLHMLEDKTIAEIVAAEIAAGKKCSESTVKRRIHEAVKTLIRRGRELAGPED